MNKTILILPLLFVLGGCSTLVPVQQKFPEAPAVLMDPCEELDIISSDQTVLSEFLKTVTKNYTKHRECAKIVVEWQNWYREQKKISDEVNK